MSIGGKLILLGAAVAVVLLIVIYGGGPATVDASPAAVLSALPAAPPVAAPPVAALPSSPPPVKASTRVVSTMSTTGQSQQPVNAGDTAASMPSIEMGKPPSANLVARLTSPRSPVMAPARTPAPKTPTTVRVRAGDTLTDIAARTLHDGNAWRRFLAVNPGLEPDRLRVGQVLKVPAKVAAKPVPAPVVAPASARTHRVGEGDTLSSIASDYYGNTQRWSEIFEANHAALNGNPDRLRVDVVLVIP